jgi:preprotein translocase subunit SecG
MPKMNTKNILVSFMALVSVLFVIASVSAADPLATINSVEVDGINVNDLPALVTDDTLTVRVEFTSLVNASDITVEVEIEGDKYDVEAQTSSFDVEEGQRYRKLLKLEIPFDLKDILSGFVDLNIDISGDGYKTQDTYTLRVQRESYNADIKSIGVPQIIKAGETFPVDIVLKNLGYNDLDDLYISASIPALGIERTGFFGDLVALECDDNDEPVDNYGVDIDRKCNEDDEDTLNRRLFLQVPYGVESGVYALEVSVENDDTTSSEVIQVIVDNAFSSGNFIVSGDNLLIVNPTNDVIVYRLVPESTAALSVSLSEDLVAIPAGSSKMVSVDATGDSAGTYTYSVNVFSVDGALLDSISFSKTVEGKDVTSPIVVLTVILAIIFIVLLIVLIVLMGKKPEKAEEFGESYY